MVRRVKLGMQEAPPPARVTVTERLALAIALRPFRVPPPPVQCRQLLRHRGQAGCLILWGVCEVGDQVDRKERDWSAECLHEAWKLLLVAARTPLVKRT